MAVFKVAAIGEDGKYFDDKLCSESSKNSE